ncbi:GGDEF domain-containing protein [Paenibacillus aceti]|nr:GGDEF domain-containing protein [Paenibacillus aceti]
MIWGKLELRNLTHKLRFLLLIGFLLGFLGILLMYYTFPLKEAILVDFREFAIMISVYVGGWVSGLITTLMIIIFQLFFIQNMDNFLPWIGVFSSIATFIISCLILKCRNLSFTRWLLTLSIMLLMSDLIYNIVYDCQKVTASLGLFTVCYSIVGLFLYIMLKYLSHSAESLRVMREAASRDFLTGFYNSRTFEVILDQQFATTDRCGIPFSLLVIDIDFFKKVNDTYGHAAGDAVLLQFAEVMRCTFRQRDHLIRLGGEEFVVLVEDCDAEQARMVAERMRSTVESTIFTLKDGSELSITVSIGCSTYPDTNKELLLEVADGKLYLAKKSGRNQVGGDE